MLEGAAGELVPGSEDAIWYDLQVGQLRAAAASECNDRTAELEAANDTVITFDDAATISCLDAVADEPAYFADECTQFDDTCPPGAPGGFGTGGYVPGTGTDTDASTADDAPATGVDTTGDGTADGSGTGAGDGTTGSGLRGLEELRARPGR
jgi:hypothetical protein